MPDQTTPPAADPTPSADDVLFAKVAVPTFAAALADYGVAVPDDAAELSRMIESSDLLTKVAAAVRGALSLAAGDPVKEATDLLLGPARTPAAAKSAAADQAAVAAIVDPAVRDAALTYFATHQGK